MRKLIYLLLITLCVACRSTQTVTTSVIEGHGDLYILHQADKSVRVMASKANGEVLDTTLIYLPKGQQFRYVAAGKDTDVQFDFPLHKRIKHSWRQDKPAKTLVVSDLHGRLDAFVALLKGNGVVDEQLHWIYGQNQLVFIGDILDRGRDDNGIAWLVYKLEKEAEKVGGRVDFLLGNHEDLVLKDDIRYVHEDHLIFAAKAHIPYAELYGANTELGKWLRDSYLILTVGENLFVHAGLSNKSADRSYKIGEINELGWRYIGYPNKQRNEMHSRNERLFGSDGPIWYRGLVVNSENHPGISSEDLDKVLDYYNTERIIVGHSEVEEIDWRYDGRVIAVNVRHYKNYDKDRTAGLLIEGDKFYSVNYSGHKVLLNK